MRRWYLVSAVVCTGWGTIPILLRSVDLPASATAFARTSIAAVALGGVVLFESRRDAAGGRPTLLSVQPARCLLTAGTLGVHWLALFAAYDRAPAGTVLLVVYLAPVGIAALAPLVLGERLGPRTLLALVIGLAGFCLLASPAASRAGLVGFALASTAMLTFVALVLLSKPLADIYGGLRLALMEMGGASVVLLPVAFLARWGPPRAVWLWLVVLGVVHTALGIALYLDALARIPATHVSIIGYLEPVAVVGFAWVWLEEAPGLESIMGGVLVLAAGLLVVLSSSEEGAISVPR